MCGIAGAVDLVAERPFPEPSLRAMCRALAHRGPDDEHVHVEPGVALGARRLSIVDLAGGRQPLANESGDVRVAFNGELFDYPELFEELAGKGHRLGTRCDTEIWVHLYEEAGEEVFARARGQFAVALWDRGKRTLLLARDRIGILPLFWARRDGWLLFSSEIKGLLASGMVQAEPDRRGLDQPFVLLASSGARTCFRDVHALLQGHFLRVRRGTVESVRYWDADFPRRGEERRAADPAPLVDELDALLRRSVRRRLRGDVPVASYLSGGIDSTLVTAIGSDEAAEPLRPFTVGLAGAGRDESSEAAVSAEHLGCTLRTVRMNRADIATAFPDLIRAAEAPVVDTSAACMVRLAEATRDAGFKVVMTGEGADELLAGYPWYKMQKVQYLTRWWTARLRYRLGLPGGLRLPRSDGPDRVTPFRGLRGSRTVQQSIYELVGRSRDRLYSAGMWQALEDHDPFAELPLPHPEFESWHPLNQALYVDLRVFLPGLLLSSKGDRPAMHASIETRPPFLDEEVVAFCARLDPALKLRRFREKWLLRQVGKRLLPGHVAARRKYPFHADSAPLFLESSRPPWVDELLSPDSLRATGYFDADAVARVREILRGPRRPHRVHLELGITLVVATQLWHHTFCGGGLADLPTWSPPASV